LITLMSMVFFLETVLAKEEEDWNVLDYFKHLPKKYLNFAGDAISSQSLSSLSQITDIQNGYIAFYEHHQAKRPWFVLTLFRSSTHGPLVAVTNRHYDFVCFWHDSFFLKREGDQWRDISTDVLPQLSPKLFYQNPKLPQYLIDYPSKTTFSYQFTLPRWGTIVNLSLDVCDYIDMMPQLLDEEINRLLHPDFNFKLKWDRNQGKFFFLK